MRELNAIIRQYHPEIVHANAAVCARIAGRLNGTVVVHTRHCYQPLSAAWRNPLIRAVGGMGNRMLSDRVIATAEVAGDNLRAMGIPDDKISLIRNGCEAVRPVGVEELARFRARYAILPDDFCVGICARLEPCKGHRTFLWAAKLVIGSLPKRRFRFLIAGDGSRRAELEQLAYDLGVAPWVTFTGFLPDPAPFYRTLRVNVNCSAGTETSCLAVSEGMSAALPTVLTDYGGNRAMLGESGAGYCIPVGHAGALAEAICRIALRPELESAMKRNARARYEQKYTADRMAEQLTAVYRNLLTT